MRRLAVSSLLLGLYVATMPTTASAGNGSNYVHLLNGIDYFFLTAPTGGSTRGIWRCFPEDMLRAPTRVTDPANPEFGNYAAKLCTVHMSATGSAGGSWFFPTIAISTNAGGCKFTQSAGTALNFGLASTGFGSVVVGPLNGNPAGVALQVVVIGTSITNPAATGTIVQVALNLNQLPGSPSTIPVPDGESMTLWLQESPLQIGPGSRMYWAGSLSERNLCSGYSFLLSAGLPIAFNPAWEWSAGVGTIDASMSATVSCAGACATGTFDQGSGTRTISITGTGINPATTTAGNSLGFAHYDENNAFGGSPKLVILNLAGFTANGAPTCTASGANFVSNPAGGPGGPPLSGLLNQPRSVARIDVVATCLLTGGFWTAATTHSGVAGGINIPWFPAIGPISGASGVTGGFQIPVPALPVLVGKQLYASGLSLNATGTAIAPLANNGHSHTNGFGMLFFP